MKFRLQILLFSLAIFILTAVGLAVVYIEKHLTFWLVLPYVFACPLVFAFAVDFLIGKGVVIGIIAIILSIFGAIVAAIGGLIGGAIAK
ncbi:MAG: hypothetical protein OEZ35_05680 [Candidatus Bathyarchaeota archaeon]|nr:hypothetical protein [Candidatus Bathyarchaeota archaeon]